MLRNTSSLPAPTIAIDGKQKTKRRPKKKTDRCEVKENCTRNSSKYTGTEKFGVDHMFGNGSVATLENNTPCVSFSFVCIAYDGRSLEMSVMCRAVKRFASKTVGH